MHPAASRALFEEDVGGISSHLLTQRSWTLHQVSYPLIDVSFSAVGRTTLRLRLTCDDWNDLPPSISLHAATGEFLTSIAPNPTSVFNPSAHHLTGRPFVCMRGSREYHTHPSHTNDLWSQIKGDYTLGGIMTQLWNAWLKGSN